MKNHLLLFSIMFSLYFYGQIPGTQNIYELNNNVGIGKSNPETKFDVLGSIQLKGSLDIFSYVWDQSYLNSRIALRSNNIKGAGIFTIGPTKTWFFGTPADDAADSFIISFDNKFEGVNSIAQKQFAKFYINSSGNIGIGNRLPQAKLHISGMVDGTFNGLIVDNLKNYGINSGVNETSRILLTLSETSYSSIDRIFGMIEAGTTSETTSINGRLSFYVRDNGNAIEKMRINSNGNVGIGTTITGSHKLAVEGSIGAREIKVEATGWSDFVFFKDYKLPTLEEVEQHIKEKGHLKDIPSAKEVEKNGIFLGEMNAKLLQKIEELTLYTIAQEKKLKEQKEKLEKEKERTTALEERLIKIEKLLKQK